MKKALKYFGIWLLIQIVVGLVLIIPGVIIMLGLESALDFGHDIGLTWLIAVCLFLINLVVLYEFWKRRSPISVSCGMRRPSGSISG